MRGCRTLCVVLFAETLSTASGFILRFRGEFSEGQISRISSEMLKATGCQLFCVVPLTCCSCHCREHDFTRLWEEGEVIIFYWHFHITQHIYRQLTSHTPYCLVDLGWVEGQHSMQASMVFLYTFKDVSALKVHDAIFAFYMQKMNNSIQTVGG